MTVKKQLQFLFRQFKRFKAQYLISFSGLFLATATFLLLLHFITYHYSFDRFHDNAGAIVRLNTVINLPGQQNKYAATAFDVGPEMAEMFPEVRHAVRVRSMPGAVSYNNQRFDEGLITFVDSSFLQVFSFEVLAGNKSNCLDAPNSMVLTKELADRYFAGEDPVGKALQLNINGRQLAMQISAVVEDPPANSSINFRMLANIRQISDAFRPGYASLIPGLFTFFQLQPGATKDQIAARLEEFTRARLPENLQTVMSFYPMPMKDLYFETAYQFDAGRKGNKNTLISLLVLAVITLVMAVINYVNISTTLGMKRSREIAVRKIMGSTASQIAAQQYTDSLAVIGLTILPAALLSKWLLPSVGSWLDLELNAGPLSNWTFWLMLAGFTLLLALLAAAYPALVLSRLSVTEVLKRNVTFISLRFDLKKVLLGFQFAVAVFFLSAAWVVFHQMQYLQQRDPGFDKEQVVLIDVAGPEMQAQIPRVKESLLQMPGVSALSASTSPIYGIHTQANFSIPADSTGNGFLLDINYVDPDFMETYQVRLLAGRDFSNEVHSDHQAAFLLNEAAMQRLGIKEPAAALGIQLQKVSRDTMQAPVIGVVADYNFQSLHQAIAPMVWQVIRDEPQNVLAMRLEGNIRDGVAGLEKRWEELQTGESLSFTFLDETMADAYRSEQQMGLFIRIISAVLLFITCTGLYGMMLFLIEQKTMEIGIRKTLGAGNWNIQTHLYGQYLGMTLLGIALGGSLAFWISNRWLENFAYHIPQQTFVIAISALLCLLLGWLSISVLSFRAGQINPVDAIRN